MTQETMLLGVTAAASTLLNLYLLIRKAAGKAEAREITPQPLSVREDRPSHDLYAPIDHGHPQYLTRAECAERHASEERREDVRSTEIKTMLTALGLKVDLHGQEAEERASRLHLRLDPLPPAIQSAREVLDNHLNDHRAGRAG
jgi:hypothetical protein